MRSTQLTPGQIARLKGDLQRLGVTQQRVADKAQPPVTKHMVCHVLAGRARSRNVVETARRLLAEQRARRAKAS